MRKDECQHINCGHKGREIVKHEAEGRGEWFERLCENHVEGVTERDPTAVEVLEQ